MECNIGKDAISLTHSKMLYFLGSFLKEDHLNYRLILHFYFTKKSTWNIWYYIVFWWLYTLYLIG